MKVTFRRAARSGPIVSVPTDRVWARTEGVEPVLRTSLAGPVRNTSLPTSHSLLPLHEAVVNAIQACDQQFGDDLTGARLQVRIFRSPQEAFDVGPIGGRTPLTQSSDSRSPTTAWDSPQPTCSPSRLSTLTTSPTSAVVASDACCGSRRSTESSSRARTWAKTARFTPANSDSRKPKKWTNGYLGAFGPVMTVTECARGR